MSRYTTEVRYICEEACGLRQSVQGKSTPDIITKARPLIFDFPYPIFQQEYKPVLEEKILYHYYTREIGLETVGLWKLKLRQKLNEIMPYYNQLYESTLLEFNPLEDTKFQREYNLRKDDKTLNNRTVDENINHDRDNTGNTSTNQTTTTNADNWNKFSDTPQGGLNGIVSTDYLTNATEDIIDSKSVLTGNTDYSDNVDEKTVRNNTDVLNGSFKANDKYLEKLSGKSSGQSFSKFLQEYRDTFLNIDMMIIAELEPLFMGIW